MARFMGRSSCSLGAYATDSVGRQGNGPREALQVLLTPQLDELSAVAVRLMIDNYFDSQLVEKN